MTAGPVNLDIGNFNERTILTDAGWTRNWGGRLAAELWQDLIAHRAIRDNSLPLSETRLRSLWGEFRRNPLPQVTVRCLKKRCEMRSLPWIARWRATIMIPGQSAGTAISILRTARPRHRCGLHVHAEPGHVAGEIPF